MAVKSSGTLSFNTDIVGEFSGDTPHSLSEYYRNGSYVTPNNTNVPTSGEISFSDFYGGTATVSASDVITPVTINGQSTAKQITISDYIDSGGVFEIPSSWWIWSDSTSTPALLIDIPCTLKNNGKIIGRGGNGGSGVAGSGGSGGPAIKINSGVSGVIIENASGAYIAGGGGGGGSFRGGGGGGAGGGSGGTGTNSKAGGAGGSINASGATGQTETSFSNSAGNLSAGGGGGGGAGGGSAAVITGTDGNVNLGGGGGGGGRILPGTGGSGGSGNHLSRTRDGVAGGSAGNAGTSGVGRPSGGGGWGASGGSTSTGGSGGSGGKAVEDSGNSYTLTNNGTIYGATT